MTKFIEKIQESFSQQAEEFENKGMNFSNQDYLDYSVKAIKCKPTDQVLEVASGTCATGRAIAPFVNHVTCLDVTPEMLNVGKAESKKANISNMTFVEGIVEELPFPDNTFDIVITRLAFHHFVNIEKPFVEMNRVLKTNGKLIIIDMEATDENLRETADKIETMRDFFHVRNISKFEFETLYKKYDYEMIKEESTTISVELNTWMNLTKTPNTAQNEIRTLMQNELEGKNKTGFSPYLQKNEIWFNQRWLLMIGIKK